ncbi:MAG TPA: hypothetical protein DEG17_19385 [Cyanobacteria bacterium UBA11149]|nr:hypothetical protein [Cyanobacteria bacterium UBA11149]
MLAEGEQGRRFDDFFSKLKIYSLNAQQLIFTHPSQLEYLPKKKGKVSSLNNDRLRLVAQ